MEIIFEVNGMMCDNCKKHVEKAIKSVKGVKKVKVSLENKCVSVIYNENKTNETFIKDVVTNAGYEAL